MKAPRFPPIFPLQPLQRVIGEVRAVASTVAQLGREVVEDYERHGASLRETSFWALAAWRFGKRAAVMPQPLRSGASVLYAGAVFAIRLSCGIEMDRSVDAGAGLHLVHGWNIKIHHDVRLGENVGIMHDVTIGTNMDRPGLPVIGNRVFIGAGARILGPVRIGDDAHIGANSLVISDVPAGTIAVGVPARCATYRGASPADVHAQRQRRFSASGAAGSRLAPAAGSAARDRASAGDSGAQTG